MPMHHNQHIADLGPLFERRGIRHVIISPGSRNAPLTQLFTSRPFFHCYSIVDERSAAYVAMGMARHLKEAVVVVCTSGTAVLNLAPAVAEAFYQQLPLIVLTADRPLETMAQFNNQAIDQRAAYFNHSKGYFEFPAEVRNEHDKKQALGAIEQLLSETVLFPAGPVHVNIPLTEPLYDKLPDPVLTDAGGAPFSEEETSLDLDAQILKKRILVLAGMGKPDPEIRNILLQLTDLLNLVVVAENIANLPSEQFLANPELILSGASEIELEELAPEVVIAFGGQVVSKGLKLLIRSLNDIEIYELGGSPLSVLRDLSDMTLKQDVQSVNEYLQTWRRIETRENKRAAAFISDAPFSNLTVIHKILSSVPQNAVVHLGNSATIRYSQLMPLRSDLTFYSNRGTSGIDGSVSAAVGAAMVSDEFHLLLVGDLSFVYDSNALWNKQFPLNLKIIIINDGGGGIFRLLEGPDKMEFFEEFSVTHHPVSLELLSQSFGRGFLKALNMEELMEKLALIFQTDSSLSVLEVDTTERENSRIFKGFMNRNQ